jgi:hypothetical protein
VLLAHQDRANTSIPDAEFVIAFILDTGYSRRMPHPLIQNGDIDRHKRTQILSDSSLDSKLAFVVNAAPVGTMTNAGNTFLKAQMGKLMLIALNMAHLSFGKNCLELFYGEASKVNEGSFV